MPILKKDEKIIWCRERQQIPVRTGGVYLLFTQDRKLAYIGESGDVRTRLNPNGHRVYNGEHIIGFIPTGRRKELEKILILSLRPSQKEHSDLFA